MTKAIRKSSPLIKKILMEAPADQRRKNQKRVEIDCRIYDCIKAKGYTCAEFAKKMDKQPSEISKWVSGTHNFTIDTLMDISFHLGIEISTLMQSENESEHKVFDSVFQITITNKFKSISLSHQMVSCFHSQEVLSISTNKSIAGNGRKLYNLSSNNGYADGKRFAEISVN